MRVVFLAVVKLQARLLSFLSFLLVATFFFKMQLPATANKLAMPALKNIPDFFVFLHLIPLLANAVTMNTYLQCAISLQKNRIMESNDSN